MTVKELVLKNRTYRRFYQNHGIGDDILRDLVDLARHSSSGANLQALKYILSTEPARNEEVFATLGWAAYLKEWSGPEEGERPAAYLIMLLDHRISGSPLWDHGIAAQSILLGAVERGLGGCMFGNVNRDRLRESFCIPEHLEILQVIALGKPKEEVRLVPVGDDGDIRYYRNGEGVHYVPKRSLKELIIE